MAVLKVHELQQSVTKQAKHIESLKLALCNKQSKSTKLNKLFQPDQLEALSRDNMRGSSWSNETVKEGLQLRFSCGARSYETLFADV